MSDALCPPANTPDRGGFDDVVVSHLDAGHRLARWLMRNDHDADDVLQEASLRALRYFQTFTGGNARAWFLRIVRNTCRGWRPRRLKALTDLFDEGRHSGVVRGLDPEALLLRTDCATLIARALCDLPDRSRELLVLRELEGLSYQELAEVMGIPLGTVMSGLSRARHSLRGALARRLRSPPGRVLPDQEPAGAPRAPTVKGQAPGSDEEERP